MPLAEVDQFYSPVTSPPWPSFARPPPRGSVEAYNKTLNSLESRALVTARRFRDMGAAGQRELEEPQPIDESPRLAEPSGGAALPGPAGGDA